jgi:integrase
MNLTHVAIKNAKPRDKDYKLSDAQGLYLLVSKKGQRYWRLNYRFGGKQKTLALGVYPDISLADARRKCAEAREAIAEGRDPGHERKIEKLTRGISAGNTFRAIAEELIVKMEREGRAQVTIDKTKWVFEFAYPFIGDRPIAEITAPEVLAVLKTVEARGRYETARRLRSKTGQVFRLAIATGRAERDPTSDLRGAIIAPQVAHRAAITDSKEVGPLLNAIDGFTGHLTTKIALKLLALTFVRPGEIRRAEWAEFDLESAIWTIPAERMKMRRPHKVPLSRQALALIKELKPLTGQSRFLFPAVNSWIRPMSENTLNAALRRLGYSKEEVTAHGFRAMAATLLNEMNRWPGDIIERQLAHQDKNAVRRAYTHGVEYWPQRIELMQVWADYLDRLQAETLSRAQK